MNPKYRADIDGLRAIAVLSVLFFHMEIRSFSGGYVGVDMFFVISGYLITTIIIREIATNEFSIARFYERRFRRIVPALTVVLAFSLALGAVLFAPPALVRLSKSAIASLLFSSNVLFYSEWGYFDSPAKFKPLLHTWSLAVEEQFYIVFPLLLILIARWSSRRYDKWLVTLGLVSFIACILGMRFDASGAFYLIPTRAWELILGSLLATSALPVPQTRHTRELLSVLGITLIVFSILYYTPDTHYPGVAAIIPTLGTALVIYSGIGGASLVCKILSFSPLVAIGLISYSLYLWHWPILVYVKHYSITQLNNVQIGAMMSVIFIISIISWRYVEKPFRDKMFLARRPKLLLASMATPIIVIAIGAFLIANGGFRNRYKSSLIESFDARDPEWERWMICENKESKISSHQDLCDIGDSGSKLSFLLWGDSHARALASAVDLSAKRSGVKGKITTQTSCPPLISIERPNGTSCHKFNQAILKYLSDAPEIKTVILAARWVMSSDGTRYKSESGKSIKLVDLQSPDSINTPNVILFELGIKRTVDALLALGKTVVLVKPVPEIGYDVPSAYFVSEITGRDVSSLVSPTWGEYMQRTKNVESIFSKVEKEKPILIVSPSTYLCDAQYCRVVFDGRALYRDNNHLSTFGSKYVSRSFDGIFE